MSLKAMQKNLLAFSMGVLLLALVEGLLAIGGVEPLAARDPFVGFSGTSPLFVQTSPGRYSLNPAKSSYFNAQSFQMPKPAGTFRIVVLGGSTTYGRPYDREVAFGAWLEKLIERYAGNEAVEVLNAGGISYASYRVRRVMQEMAAYEPDLFVLYSGHNEFLEARTFSELREQSEFVRTLRGMAHHSRIYSVLARMLGRAAEPSDGSASLGDNVEAMLEKVGGPDLYRRDEVFRQGVIHQYRHEISEMVRFCREEKIPLVMATLPVNLSGVSPFKSEHARQLDAKSSAKWSAAFARGNMALDQKQPEQAIAAYFEAEALDSGFAELHYRMGMAYLLLGQDNMAYRAFDLARQEDIVPLRAINELNDILRDIAEQEGVPLADVEKTFVRVSPGHIPGENLFVDHVHPTIEGQQLVAWVIVSAATDAGLLPLDPASWRRAMPEAREFLRDALNQISESYRVQGLWGVGRLYFWAGKYPEAYVALIQAWQVIKDKPELARQLGELELMRGDAAAALTYLDVAEKLAPGDYKVTLTRAAALNRLGRFTDAQLLLDSVAAVEGDKRAGLDYMRGETSLLLGRPAEAVQHFRRAVEYAPLVPGYRLGLANAYKLGGDVAQARAAYRDYLAMLPSEKAAPPLETWIKAP